MTVVVPVDPAAVERALQAGRALDRRAPVPEAEQAQAAAEAQSYVTLLSMAVAATPRAFQATMARVMTRGLATEKETP